MSRKPEIVWRRGSSPYSPAYDDIYFSAEDGLAESREVFIAGNNLPQAWHAHANFTICELGFGLGRNFCATARLWQCSSHPPQQLHYIGIDHSPVSATDITQALVAWDDLNEICGLLTHRYPTTFEHSHTLTFPELRVSLTLLFQEAATALTKLTDNVDCWYLDGFSPAKNPEMYQSAVIAHIAHRSRPGTTLATYSAASSLRRALEAHGFSVHKLPGFGMKRERLNAVFEGT